MPKQNQLLKSPLVKKVRRCNILSLVLHRPRNDRFLLLPRSTLEEALSTVGQASP